MIDNNGQVKTPDWAYDAIWYQVFPERFRAGIPHNYPEPADMKADEIPGWKLKNWGSDWYSEDEWEQKHCESIFQSIFLRRYGGDLQGIIDKLDYIKGLGANAIYLNPVFRSPSLHKYDGSSFHHVDETFGPDKEGDYKMIEDAGETDDPQTWVWTAADRLFLKLVKEAHKRGLKVIIDGVFNHSGRFFFAFEDLLKNGKDSRYVDWFQVTKWDENNLDGFEYSGWWGLKEHPEFRRDENDVNPGYKKYLENITRRWMAPEGKVEDGVDGWRLDVAFCLPHGFWKDWYSLVKSINPDAYTTGEVIETAPEYLQGDEFDALMNYPFMFNCIEFFIDDKMKITASEFDKKLKTLRDAYPEPITYVMQNLLSSHDTPRVRTLVVNNDFNVRDWEGFHTRSKVERNPDYLIHRGDEIHRQIHKLLAIFQMTYVGAPMIYYGDETGMTGANDPDCRKPMLWDDVKFEDEVTHPHPGKSRPREKNEVDRELFEHYKKMIAIRNENVALRRGAYKTVLTDDENAVFAFERTHEGQRIVVVVNNSKKVHPGGIALGNGLDGEYVDLLNDKNVTIKGGVLKEVIEPLWALVLKKK